MSDHFGYLGKYFVYVRVRAGLDPINCRSIGRLVHVSMALLPHVYMQNGWSKKSNSTLNTLLFQIKFLKFKEHLVINQREREQSNQRESIGA